MIQMNPDRKCMDDGQRSRGFSPLVSSLRARRKATAANPLRLVVRQTCRGTTATLSLFVFLVGIVVIVMAAAVPVQAFVAPNTNQWNPSYDDGCRCSPAAAATQARPNARLLIVLLSANTEPSTEVSTTPTPTAVEPPRSPERRPACYYRNSATRHQWRLRTDLSDLVLGQELCGVVVQELLVGRTGPKLWIDCGVGRYRVRAKDPHKHQPPSPPQPNWKITTAMLRLGQGYMKESVARKKAAKLRSKDSLTVYVSRIRLAQDQFEVVLSPDDVANYQRATPLQSVSRLKPHDRVTGTVVRVEDYGVLVDIDGYNRVGLLHIQRVADLYGTYIDKKQGLEEAGLERGARVKLQVAAAVEKKRLFLDFTDDVKEEAAAEQQQRDEQEANEALRQQAAVPLLVAEVKADVSTVLKELPSVAEEDDNWDEEYNDDEEEEYDACDEERDIEDSLGLGTY